MIRLRLWLILSVSAGFSLSLPYLGDRCALDLAAFSG